VVPFDEDKAAAYYYDREIMVRVPDDMPPGIYDLTVTVAGNARAGVCRSPRSVYVVNRYPIDPVFISFGHLDTSGQHQAEYLERLVDVINVIGPDMVLCSNACNAGYVSGALASLDIPYVINFGNHQFPGHEAWYGDPVGLVDYGPNISVLNFGLPWHCDQSKAKSLLNSRPKTPIRVVNAFEPNAPIPFLDRQQIRLIHDAHGTGKKVADFGATPTRRIGKTNSESFRIVRFLENSVASCTYNGHETAPVPYPRESPPPITLSFKHANDGTHDSNAVTVTNRLADAITNGRVCFILPSGEYQIDRGRHESLVTSDDGQYIILTIRLNIPANGVEVIRVEPHQSAEE
jgi:hypothetical protein